MKGGRGARGGATGGGVVRQDEFGSGPFVVQVLLQLQGGMSSGQLATGQELLGEIGVP